MANTINAIQCAASLKNTGVCECFFDPKLIVGKILVPKTKVFTQAELNDIQATLETLAIAAKVNRIYPVQGLVAVTDSTEEPTFQTFGYGTAEPVREGKYNWIFGFRNGGVQLNNSLRSFNGNSKYAEIYIDSNNTLIGTKKLDVNGDTGLAGIPPESGYPYTYPWKVSDGSNLTSYRTQSVFQPLYINDNIAFVRVPATTYLLTELIGLEDVKLSIVAVDTINDVVTIKAITDCGKDLYEDFADELAEVTAWVGANSAGTAIVHTVTKNDGAQGWDIAYTTAVVAEGDTWELAAPSVLAAAPINVPGYESDTVTVTLGS